MVKNGSVNKERPRNELLPAQRQRMIKDYLVEAGFVSITSLGRQFNVSEMTIRRDLEALERQGLIQRTYGGARPTEPTFFEMSFQAKASQHEEEKRRIGLAASAMIQEGQTILLDSGTTTDQIMRGIQDTRITVISNALNVILEAVKHPRVEVMVAGGMLRKGLNYTTGPQTSDFMKTIRADILFMGVEGVDVRAGFTVPDLLNADNKRAMANAAQRVIVVADHSKLGRISTSSIFPLNGASLLITGQEADPEMIEQLRRQIEVQLV